MTTYGVAIFGIPGAGKTTLTNSLCELYNRIGRPFKVVNLDPASSVEADFNIEDIVSVADVEERLKIGPNGSVNVCFEFLFENIGHIRRFIEQNSRCFYVFDMPGEVEAIISTECVRQLLLGLKMQLAVAFLTDSAELQSVDRFVSIFLQTAAAEAQLALPFISVLTKVDLVEVDVDYFFECEPQDKLHEFVQNNFVPSIRMCCFDVEDVKMLANEVDSRVEYFRGEFGEYVKVPREEMQEIEAFMDNEQAY